MSADAAARPTGRRATAWLKPLIWGLALTPLIGLVWLTSSDGLGPNPQEALIRATGDWALRGLCVALAVVISIGSVGLPGSAIFMGTNLPVVQAAGLPVEPMGLLVAVDMIPDVFATLGNVTADLTVTSKVARSES